MEYDYLKFYESELEHYLLNEVREKFKVDNYLNTSDFFCIVIWKSNRVKTIIRDGLKKSGNLEKAIEDLTKRIYKEPDLKKKLAILMKIHGIALPMASAILTILYPNDFTIYDIRVCESLEGKNEQGKFHKLANKTDFAKIWQGYLEFKAAVIQKTPTDLSLRDKDRYLWGMSFKKDLDELLKN